MSTLSAQSLEFAGKITPSKLNHGATYSAYRQYRITYPQVGFSLPAQSLWKQECKYIQFPAIYATLYPNYTSTETLPGQ
jgi:hypothetical protein